MKDELNNCEVVDTKNLPTATENTDDILAMAEKRMATLQKVINLALKITNSNDWTNLNGKPYLNGSGTQKVARLFGVCWTGLQTKKNISTDETGQFYFYETSGIFYLKGKDDIIEATGTCSVKDLFFSRANGQTKPNSEIDETNILKSSITNCISNGITSLLGLKGLTWEQVEAAGIKKDKTASVTYTQNDSVISEAQRKRLFAIAKEGGYQKEDVTTFIKETYKIEHTDEILKKNYEAICKHFEVKKNDTNS